MTELAHTPARHRQERPVAWRLNSEVVLILGWPRAILMQLAHPLVAAGVADHSTFQGGVEESYRRLHNTVGAMLAFTFGSREEVQRTAEKINRVHDRVHGTLEQPAGLFGTGTAYSAHDAELLGWVHATLLDTNMRVYEHYVAPLSAAEKDRYCREAQAMGPLLGIPPEHLPSSLEALQAYMTRRMEAEVVVTPTARRLAGELLSIPLTGLGGPLSWLYRFQTIGLLPPQIREGYGFSWGPLRQAGWRSSAWAMRLVVRLTPALFRHWPQARRAMSGPSPP